MPVQIIKYAVIFHNLCQSEWNASQNRLTCYFQHHCMGGGLFSGGGFKKGGGSSQLSWLILITINNIGIYLHIVEEQP